MGLVFPLDFFRKFILMVAVLLSLYFLEEVHFHGLLLGQLVSTLHVISGWLDVLEGHSVRILQQNLLSCIANSLLYQVILLFLFINLRLVLVLLIILPELLIILMLGLVLRHLLHLILLVLEPVFFGQSILFSLIPLVEEKWVIIELAKVSGLFEGSFIKEVRLAYILLDLLTDLVLLDLILHFLLIVAVAELQHQESGSS